jgi:hypothetical protein
MLAAVLLLVFSNEKKSMLEVEPEKEDGLSMYRE